MNILAKRVFLLLTVFGFVVLSIEFLSAALFISIPYQDASLQLLRQQDAQVAIARRFYLASFIMFSSRLLEICEGVKSLISLLFRSIRSKS